MKSRLVQIVIHYFDSEQFESNWCKSKKPCKMIIDYSNSYKCKKKFWVLINFNHQRPLFILLLLGGSITYDSPCSKVFRLTNLMVIKVNFLQLPCSQRHPYSIINSFDKFFEKTNTVDHVLKISPFQNMPQLPGCVPSICC